MLLSSHSILNYYSISCLYPQIEGEAWLKALRRGVDILPYSRP